jgi:hypothetical protein
MPPSPQLFGSYNFKWNKNFWTCIRAC